MIPVRVPETGESGSTLLVGVWLINPGESVAEHESLVELILPGVLIDIPSPATGTLNRVELSTGRNASPGDVLGWVEPEQDASVE